MTAAQLIVYLLVALLAGLLAERLVSARELNKFPRLAEALFDSGYLAYKQHDVPGALTLFRELVQLAHRAIGLDRKTRKAYL